MVGIQSLMPGQAMQPTAPPPQQTRSAPQALVGPMEQQIQQRMAQGEPVDQILRNPPPVKDLWAFFTALGEAAKKQQMRQSIGNNQSAMAGAQQAQMPPVVQQVADAARQAQGMQGVQTAAMGGVMRGYNGGGIVALQRGGFVPGFATGTDEEGVQSSPAWRWLKSTFSELSEKEDLQKLRNLVANKYAMSAAPLGVFKQQSDQERQFAKDVMSRLPQMSREELTGLLQEGKIPTPPSTQRTPEEEIIFASLSEPPKGPMMEPPRLGGEQVRKVTPTGIAQVTTPAAPPTESDIEREVRAAEAEKRKVIEGMKNLPAGAVTAREQYDQLVKDILAGNKAERERLGSAAEKRYEEAKGRAGAQPFDDLQYIGAMLSGMKGTKRFGDALSGMMAGLGEEKGRRQDALRKAEETYDLRQGELFKLQQAQQQVAIDQAKLNEARATGDQDRINKANMELAASKETEAKLAFEIRDKIQLRQIEERKAAAEESKARTAATHAGEAAQMNQYTRLSGQLGDAVRRREEELRKSRDQHEKRYDMLYKMAKIPNAPLTPEMQKQLADAETEWKILENRINMSFAPQINSLSSTLYGAPYESTIPPGVKVTKTGG